MRIWLIGRGYPTTSNGMWGSFELEQAKLLARNGHEVFYIALTLSFLNRKDPRGFRKFEEEGVRIYTYSHLYFPGKLGFYWKIFEDNCWKLLLDKVKDDSGMPEIIHVHYPSMISSIQEIEKYRSAGVRLFVTEHWSRVLINTLKKHEIDRLRYYGANANCFISVGQQLLEAASNLVDISVSTEIIPNLVSPLFTAEKNTHSNFTFVAIGRLVGLKQFDVVIQQFIEQFSENDNIRLVVIGSGSERKKLENLAIGNDKIRFAGELKLKDVAVELNKADVLVSFSKYETFCVPVAEAWLCGKPTIISDKEGVVSYLNHNLGISVPYNKPSLLGDAMHEIYDNYEKYDSELISEYARSIFSEQVIYDKLITTYEKY